MDLLALIAGCAIGHLPLPDSHHQAEPQTVAVGWAAACTERGGPWDAFIVEAARRFALPPRWIRGVMRAESGGFAGIGGRPTTSPAGAMGLMQIMPATYEDLKERYGLGDDPYRPRDNILAGAAYLREMFDRFGAPDFLAAYNAGPQRVADYRTGTRPLPSQTIQYVARVASQIFATAAPSSLHATPVDTGTASAARAAPQEIVGGLGPIAFRMGLPRGHPRLFFPVARGEAGTRQPFVSHP